MALIRSRIFRRHWQPASFLSMAVCALALVIAFAFKRANYAVQTVVLTSLPCVFITGDLFPLQNIPDYAMNIIAFFIPSAPAN